MPVAKKVTAAAKKTVAAKRPSNKGPATKKVELKSVYQDAQWVVRRGLLQKPVKRGRPVKEAAHLFQVVGEKLPYESLKTIRAAVKEQLGGRASGVYIAHDSMGCPRYIGRGDIFARLEARKKAQQLELEYFSFYVVAEKKHEREVETLLIRTTGFLLEFNSRKKRVGLGPGNIRDYEAGTKFYERQYKKGVKKKVPA